MENCGAKIQNLQKDGCAAGSCYYVASRVVSPLVLNLRELLLLTFLQGHLQDCDKMAKVSEDRVWLVRQVCVTQQ